MWYRTCWDRQDPVLGGLKEGMQVCKTEGGEASCKRMGVSRVELIRESRTSNLRRGTKRLSERWVSAMSDIGTRYQKRSQNSPLDQSQRRSSFLRSLAHGLLPYIVSLNPSCPKWGWISKSYTNPVSHGMTRRSRVTLRAGLYQVVNSLGLGFFHPVPGAICCYNYRPTFIHLFSSDQQDIL